MTSDHIILSITFTIIDVIMETFGCDMPQRNGNHNEIN